GIDVTHMSACLFHQPPPPPPPLPEPTPPPDDPESLDDTVDMVDFTESTSEVSAEWKLASFNPSFMPSYQPRLNASPCGPVASRSAYGAVASGRKAATHRCACPKIIAYGISCENRRCESSHCSCCASAVSRYRRSASTCCRAAVPAAVRTGMTRAPASSPTAGTTSATPTRPYEVNLANAMPIPMVTATAAAPMPCHIRRVRSGRVRYQPRRTTSS